MITSAAVKYYVYPFHKELIIPVHRHKDGETIFRIFDFHTTDYRLLEEGFLTDRGEFIGRPAAVRYAFDCGQLDHHSLEDIEYIFDSGMLMSEDLW